MDPDTTPTEGQGLAEAPPQETAPVQPTAGDEAQPSSESAAGQDFIAPYLEGVDESIRGTVAEKLEAYRRDADAQATRRFQQIREETEIPVRLYDALLDDPVGTLQWVMEQFDSRGVDVRSQLLAKIQQAQEAAADPAPPSEDQPLTVAQYQALQEQQRQEAAKQQQQEQAVTRVNGWIDQAAAAEKITIPPAMRVPILQLANTPEVAREARGDGEKAVKIAISMLRQSLAPAPAPPPSTTQTPEPKIADAGGAALPSDPKLDLTDPKARRDHMLAMLQASSTP